MKKISFKDQFGLTIAVLEGYKTMTRRIITNKIAIAHCENGLTDLALNYAQYHIGDYVAIATNYKNSPLARADVLESEYGKNIYDKDGIILPGWKNKMFVKAKLMLNHILITNVRIERLQEIGDEDCLREGINKAFGGTYDFKIINGDKKKIMLYDNPKEAFAALIDKVSGKGTWERNPWCFVYEFECINPKY